MLYIIKYIYGLRIDILDKADPRVAHYPLLGSPIPVAIIAASYLLLVLKYGPKWMAQRKPIELKYVLRVYNVIQMLSNILVLAYGFSNCFASTSQFSFSCQRHEPNNTEPWMLGLITASYGYYLIKYLDLFDTVFFVLRKKDKQISFLHVYHHVCMILSTYVGLKFLPGSHATMLGLVNCSVHIVMYSYYFVMSLDVFKSSPPWWKRYITLLQMIQFIILSIHFGKVFIYNPCQFPLWLPAIAFIQNIFMLALFMDFYYRAYLQKAKNK